MMIFLTLFGLSVTVAIVIFLFTVLWYTKLFKNQSRDFIELRPDFNVKKAFMVEFLSSFLLAVAVVVIFAPFNLYFGLINGAIIAISIMLPIAISKFTWQETSFKLLLTQTFHRFFQVIIAFSLTGALNSIVFPFLASRII